MLKIFPILIYSIHKTLETVLTELKSKRQPGKHKYFVCKISIKISYATKIIGQNTDGFILCDKNYFSHKVAAVYTLIRRAIPRNKESRYPGKILRLKPLWTRSKFIGHHENNIIRNIYRQRCLQFKTAARFVVYKIAYYLEISESLT